MSERERIAYEELQPGTEVQAGDQYRNTQGRWVEYSMDTSGVPIVGPTAMARRPYKISTIQEIGDALASAQKAATQLQDERDEAHRERDLARTEVARLSTELWARKPLEERVASLTEELAQAREASQQLLQTIADNADQFAWANKTLEQQRDEARAEVAKLQAEQQELTERLHGAIGTKAAAASESAKAKDDLKSTQRARDELQRQVDELRADRDKLQGLIDDLLDEPTARQVQDMLRTWATELDWSADCFDSEGRDQINSLQGILIAVMERVEHMINPEAISADA